MVDTNILSCSYFWNAIVQVSCPFPVNILHDDFKIILEKIKCEKKEEGCVLIRLQSCRFSLVIHQILEKKWECNDAVHQLCVDFTKAYDLVRRAVLYNILIEFHVPMKLVRLIKICLTETCSRVWVGKNMSDMFHIRNGLK